MWYRRLTSGAPLAVLVAAGLFIAYMLLPVMELIAVAMLVALVLRTIVQGMERARVPTWLAASTMVTGVAAFAALLWLVAVPNMVREAQLLASAAPRYIKAVTNLADDLAFVPSSSQLAARLQDLFSQAARELPSLAKTIAALTGATVGVLFMAVYMSIDPAPLVSGALRAIPQEKRGRARELLEAIEARLRRWLVGTAIVSMFIGGGGALGLWLLGAPLPITFGIIAGVLNVVPYLGSTVGALLPALVALTVSPIKALQVVVLFVVLNQIEGNFLQPLVMGRAVRLHPAVVISSFLVMGTLLSIVGLLLAVPAAVVVATLMEELSPQETASEGEQRPKEDPPTAQAPDAL